MKTKINKYKTAIIVFLCIALHFVSELIINAIALTLSPIPVVVATLFYYTIVG